MRSNDSDLSVQRLVTEWTTWIPERALRAGESGCRWPLPPAWRFPSPLISISLRGGRLVTAGRTWVALPTSSRTPSTPYTLQVATGVVASGQMYTRRQLFCPGNDMPVKAT
jgi:hypothetical protein